MLKVPDETLPVYWPALYLYGVYPSHQERATSLCSMYVGRGTCCPSFVTHDISEQQPSSQSDSWQEILQPWQKDRPPPHWGVVPKGLFLSAKAGTLQEEKHLWPVLPLGMHAINPVNVKKTWPSTMDNSLFFWWHLTVISDKMNGKNGFLHFDSSILCKLTIV